MEGHVYQGQATGTDIHQLLEARLSGFSGVAAPDESAQIRKASMQWFGLACKQAYTYVHTTRLSLSVQHTYTLDFPCN